MEAPTSYIQSLIARIINNVSIVCNNVILKYVEDDIVLSINVKTLELKTVNGKWQPAFVGKKYLIIIPCSYSSTNIKR